MGSLSVKNHDGLIELFSLDLTAWSGGIIRVCNSRLNKDDVLSESTVSFGGQTYITLPFESANWKRGGERAERPKITLPDGELLMWSQLLAMDGAPGAPVTRIQVMAADLIANDQNAILSVERYLLDKPTHDAGKLTLELNAPHAFRKTRFPAKQMLRDEYGGLGVQLLR